MSAYAWSMSSSLEISKFVLFKLVAASMRICASPDLKASYVIGDLVNAIERETRNSENFSFSSSLDE